MFAVVLVDEWAEVAMDRRDNSTSPWEKTSMMPRGGAEGKTKLEGHVYKVASLWNRTACGCGQMFPT